MNYVEQDLGLFLTLQYFEIKNTFVRFARIYHLSVLIFPGSLISLMNGYDEKGQKIKNGDILRTNDGNCRDYKVFLKILEAHSVTLIIAHLGELPSRKFPARAYRQIY